MTLQTGLILEGLHILSHADTARLLTVRLFIDTPADVRLIRRLRRDIRERGRTVESVLRQYETEVRPMHVAHVQPSRKLADLVLDGTRAPGDNVASILRFLEARGLQI